MLAAELTKLRYVLTLFFLLYWRTHSAFVIVIGVLDTSMETRSVGRRFLTARSIISIAPLLSLLVMFVQPLMIISFMRDINCLFRSYHLPIYCRFRQLPIFNYHHFLHSPESR
jgi:hypothetical protein